MTTSYETSTEAKQTARWSDEIASEISAIEKEINTAVKEGKFTCVVSDTIMTSVYGCCMCPCDCSCCKNHTCENVEIGGDGYSDNYKYEYYKVWKQEIENMPCQDAMNQVIKYFTDKKFTISRQTNPYTKKSFFWIVSWS